MSESEVAHIAGCPAQPADDQRPGGFCIACALERLAEDRALIAFQRMVRRWFVQPTWGRG